MVLSIYIGFRHCGKRTISVIVDYSIKSRQLNPTTVIFVINVELIDGGEVKNQWFLSFLVPITKASLVFPQFSGKIYSESSYHRFCFKFNRSF